MNKLTEQQKARIVTLALACELWAGLGRDRLTAYERKRIAECSAEAFRIAKGE